MKPAHTQPPESGTNISELDLERLLMRLILYSILPFSPLQNETNIKIIKIDHRTEYREFLIHLLLTPRKEKLKRDISDRFLSYSYKIIITDCNNYHSKFYE